MEQPRDAAEPEREGLPHGDAIAHDPWKDGPRWSEPGADPWAAAPGRSAPAENALPAAPSGVSPAGGPSGPGTEEASATCPWCATPAAPGGRTCSSCGAALAQRESIGDLVIPGLTAVDPALKDLADRPLHLSGPSPSHGVASGAIAAAAMGGPVGMVILGGVAAVAAAEYAGAGRNGDGTSVPADHVGQASSAALQAIEKLERGEQLPPADSTTPRPELETIDVPGGVPAQEETQNGG